MNKSVKNTWAAIFAAVFFVIAGGVGAAFAADSVRIMDNGDPGFGISNPTQWFQTDKLGFSSDYLSGIGTGMATWSFSVNPGSYRVSITWYDAGSPYNMANSSAAPISVAAGSTVLMSGTLNFRTKPVDRTDLGVGWKDLGVFDLTSSPLEIRLSATASAYVIADAVRIERMDGQVITSPIITSTIPKNSPLSGGIPVTILGEHFSDGSSVRFGSKVSSQVTFVSSTELKAIAPANAAGAVDVTVSTPEGLSAVFPATFKYAVGRTLDDKDAGFDATQPALTTSQVGFENDYVQPGGPAGAASASWTLAVNKQPTQRVAVTWHDAGAPYNSIYSDDVRFEVMDGPNVLAVVAANLQEKPDDFTDLGCGWKDLGSFAFSSGQIKVVLRNNTAKVIMADAIRVEEVRPAPVLTSLTPNTGPVTGGTTVMLTGSRFVDGATVKFGNKPAQTVTFKTSRSLKVVTPASVSGTVAVVVTNPDGKSTSLANAFTFQPALALQAFTPQFQLAKTVVEAPEFRIAEADGTVAIYWPATANGYLLQEAATLGPTANWTTVTTLPTQIDGQNRVSIATEAVAKFYRLTEPDSAK